MDNLPTTEILVRCVENFVGVRKNLLVGAALLSEISEKELWRDQYSSFAEYVESECQISLSFASKLLKNYRAYVIEGGLPQQQLETVDYEKAYIALSLPGTLSEKLEKARSLSREELKDEVRDEKVGRHACEAGEERWARCTKCGKFIRT